MTPEEQALLLKIFNSVAFQNLIGSEEWDLTEDEENRLWYLIRKMNHNSA